MVKKGAKPEIKTAEKPELVSAEVEESADEDIQQDFKFCVKTHKRKILMFQMELVAVSKEFCEIKNNVKDDNLKLFEGKVLALEEQVCSIYLITLDNVEQCGDELEARAERLLDDARALSRSCSALLNNCDKSRPESCSIVSREENLESCSWSRIPNAENLTKSFEPVKNKITTNLFKQKSDIDEFKLSNSYLQPMAPTTNKAFENKMPPHSSLVIGPRLKLDTFNGDVLKYLTFKRKFIRMIENEYLDFDIRFAFLEEACVGRSQQVIAGLSCLEDREQAYNMAWSRLDKRFGNRTKLMSLVKQDLEDPPIKEWDANALIDLWDKMYKCETSFFGWRESHLLNNDDLLQKVFQRLPYKLKSQFVSIVDKGLGTFTQLRELVENAASEADTAYGQLLSQGNVRKSNNNQGVINKVCKRTCVAQQHLAPIKPAVEPPLCVLCSENHEIWKCAVFESKSIKERLSLAQTFKLCFNCLRTGHRVSQCRWKVQCKKCGRRHNLLLHADIEDQTNLPASQDKKENLAACTPCNNSASSFSGRTIFKVVPVKVWYDDPSKYVCTYAFIDEGSSVNMCSAELAERLGVPVKWGNVELITANAITHEKKKVDFLAIQEIEEESAFMVKDALVQDSIVDVSSSIPTHEMVKGYSHLRDLKFPKIENQKIELLLGSDLHQAYLSQDIRVGAPGNPTGLRTHLGWTVYGKDDGDQEINTPKLMVNFLDKEESCKQILDLLNQDFKDLELPQVPALSVEDKRALGIMHKTVKKVDGHYLIGLLWKDDEPKLPNNREMALKRLLSLKQRFLNDSNLFKKYCEKMMEYIDCNYAVRILDQVSSSPGKISYIPHHCTSILTKFRVVFDCSARFNNVSLNDMLLHGPDLTNNLLGVLLRFRQHPIAVVCDIKAMFSQVFVDERDQNAFRFLWFLDNDLDQPPVDYLMRTHVFGAKSSPCCAAFALRMTATDNLSGADDETIQTVMRNVYVDDICRSCESVEKTINLVSQLCELLKGGGFYVTKFLSNNKHVLSSIPQEDLASDIDLDECRLPSQKALGVFWDAATDRMRVNVNLKERPCTRRGILSTISQTYDPLGLIQPFLLSARQMLQKACQANGTMILKTNMA